MNQEKADLPEHFPAISVDLAYGELVNDIDPDIEAIAELLREKGLSDEEIDATKIHFGGISKEHIGGNQELARYNPKDKTITMHANLVEAARTNLLPAISRHTGFGKAYEAVNDRLEGGLNTTLRHELEHRISDNDGNHEEKRQYRLSHLKKQLFNTALWVGGAIAGVKSAEHSLENLPESAAMGLFGVAAVSMYLGHKETSAWIARRSYKNDPEEKRANFAMQHDPRSYLNISLK